MSEALPRRTECVESRTFGSVGVGDGNVPNYPAKLNDGQLRLFGQAAFLLPSGTLGDIAGFRKIYACC